MMDGWIQTFQKGWAQKKEEWSFPLWEYMVVFSGMVRWPTLRGKVGHSRWMTVWLRPCDSELEERPETVPYWIFVADHLIKVKKRTKPSLHSWWCFWNTCFSGGELRLLFSGGTLTSLAFSGQAVSGKYAVPEISVSYQGKCLDAGDEKTSQIIRIIGQLVCKIAEFKIMSILRRKC